MTTTDVIVRGDASGFAQEIVLAALGSCTSMTVSLYARTKKWPFESVTVNLRHSKIHAVDCRNLRNKGRQARLGSINSLSLGA
jgi:putative redox protein